jgi:Leucyl aminopeptidase
LDKIVDFIGCGITFDCGGLCVKTSHEMEYWHVDTAEAAGVVATIQLMMHLHLLCLMKMLQIITKNLS